MAAGDSIYQWHFETVARIGWLRAYIFNRSAFGDEASSLKLCTIGYGEFLNGDICVNETLIALSKLLGSPQSLAVIDIKSTWKSPESFWSPIANIILARFFSHHSVQSIGALILLAQDWWNTNDPQKQVGGTGLPIRHDTPRCRIISNWASKLTVEHWTQFHRNHVHLNRRTVDLRPSKNHIPKLWLRTR